jgi:hypothetical protein
LAVLLGFNIAMFGYAKPPGLTNTVLVDGTWKARGTGPAATIQFSSDGTFTATSLPDPRSGIQQPLPGDQRGTWTIDREGGTKWFVFGILAANTQMRFTMVVRLTMDLPIPVTGDFLVYDIAGGSQNTDTFSKQL